MFDFLVRSQTATSALVIPIQTGVTPGMEEPERGSFSEHRNASQPIDMTQFSGQSSRFLSVAFFTPTREAGSLADFGPGGVTSRFRKLGTDAKNIAPVILSKNHDLDLRTVTDAEGFCIRQPLRQKFD